MDSGWGCNGKEGFNSRGTAIEAHRKRIKRCRTRQHPHKDKARDMVKLQVYQCELCQRWHIGGDHRPNIRRKR